MMSWPSADELWLHQHHQPNSAQVNPFSSSHRMQGKERVHTSSSAAPAGQQQQASRHWQELLQHHKAPVQLAGTTSHSNPPTHPATAGDHGSTERPAWLSFLQGMLDAHQKHHLDGISISRDNSSIKHSKSSSSKQSHRKGHHALAAPVAAAAAAAAAVPADNSSTMDNDVVAAPHSPTAHAAWPVCWPYV